MILQILFILSCFFALAGALGILRMPDVYLRVHTNTVCTVGGTILLLFSLALTKDLLTALKLFLIILFIFLTSPTDSHIIANSAYHSGIKPVIKTTRFEG